MNRGEKRNVPDYSYVSMCERRTEHRRTKGKAQYSGSRNHVRRQRKRRRTARFLLVSILVLSACVCFFQWGLPQAEILDLRFHGTPDSLIELAQKNPETYAFARNYAKDHDTDFAIDIREEASSGEIPHFYQWDKRWGYHKYGEDMIAVTGCGPTCLSMVYTGLTGRSDMDPLTMARFAEDGGYYVDGAGSAWSLMTEGADSIGLSSAESVPDAASIINALDSGNVIVAVMGPGDFTDRGHFIVLTGASGDQIRLNDPNSRKRSNELWDVETLVSQMKDMWIFYRA